MTTQLERASAMGRAFGDFFAEAVTAAHISGQYRLALEEIVRLTAPDDPVGRIARHALRHPA